MLNGRPDGRQRLRASACRQRDSFRYFARLTRRPLKGFDRRIGAAAPSKRQRGRTKCPAKTKGKFKNPKLQEAYEHFFGEQFDNAHSAMADTKACMKVYWACIGDEDSAIVLLRANIEKEKRGLMYADSPQSRKNQLREINDMEAQLKELEDHSND